MNFSLSLADRVIVGQDSLISRPRHEKLRVSRETEMLGMAEIQRADDRRRKVAIIVLVVALISGVVLWVVFEEWMMAVRRLPVEAARASLSKVFSLCMASMVLCVCVVGWHCWRVGARVRRSLRFPPPDATVVRDTIVLSGQAAVSRGRLLQVFGVILILCAIGLAVMSWLMLKMLHGALG